MTQTQFARLKAKDRRAIDIEIDGRPFTVMEGDTVLTAMLLSGRVLHRSDLGGEDRAGFCLMGACQDCFVWLADGGRRRACTTLVSTGLRISTSAPDLTA